MQLRVPLHSDLMLFNIGTGNNIPLINVATEMLYELKSDKKNVVNNKVRKGDIRDMQACTRKAETFLNWNSKIFISQGIAKYCQFLKKNWDKFKKGDTNKIADLELINRNLI
jgi:nucleoside-diphosphate-sugar epimerase